jgi:hypothetical protein
LGSRRLKLFVVAYLRGLLTPYYKNGLRSRIREDLVLEALSDELDASTLTNSLSADIGLISTIQGENLSGLYDGIYAKISKIRALKEFDKKYDETHNTYTGDPESATTERHKTQSAEGLAKLYKVLEKSGTLTKIADYKPEEE